MTTWTLLLIDSPANTVSGTGLITPLTLASDISMTYSLDDIDTLSFKVPGRHYQTGLIVEGDTDVLAVRDDVVMQRFRVIARSFSSSGASVECAVTCSAYREIVNQWIFHDETVNEGHRSWSTPTEQTAIAWTILNDGQTKPYGNLGVTRGSTPSTEVLITLETPDVTTEVKRLEFFNDGDSRGEGIQSLANGVQTQTGISAGFEWTIEPSTLAPMTGMKFNTWNKGDRHYAGSVPSQFLLSEANMAEWSVSYDMANYFNVGRVAVAEGSSTNFDTTDAAVVSGFEAPVWIPSDQTPAAGEDQRRGRWEKNIANDSYDTVAQVTAYAQNQYAEAHDRFDEWSCTLQPGRWNGQADFWIGDSLRIALRVPAVTEDGTPTGDQNLDIDKILRVHQISVTVASGGTEQVQLSLNRPPSNILSSLLDGQKRVDTISRS